MTYLEMKLLTEALNAHSRKPKGEHTPECCAEARELAKGVVGGKFAEEEKPAAAPKAKKVYEASPRQVKFVSDLTVSRDLSRYIADRAQKFLDGETKPWAEARWLIDTMLTLPKLDRADTFRVADSEQLASPNQNSWCRSLVETKVGGELFEEINMDTLTKAQARKIIDTLKDAPKVAAEALASKHFPAGQGIYQLDGEYYMVQVAIHGSGRLMCKKFRESDGYFVRVGGMGGKLTEENKLTTEEAYAYLGGFAQLYGHCMACGRGLTDSESKKYRMGPVCRDKAGL